MKLSYMKIFVVLAVFGLQAVTVSEGRRCCPSRPLPGPSCGENEQLFGSECLCIPGYRLEFGACVLECTTDFLGPTLIEYPEQEVRCALGNQFPATLEECKTACTTGTICQSAVYYDGTGLCYISPCDPFRAIVPFPFPNPITYNVGVPGATLFVRNCNIPE